ncbi:MAG: glutaminyl-tRNA synthase (glutamine-hydrolyzing) subunit A [Candidatus Yanofskybacteria bacterium RIFCSPLOWO2_01_FULL_49_25]|uniref:Glutamyl-tRNA(Gln) amidotransferase subunit A n=1 Tax=Candidatus Yanofskybacteria bacterium RIFCSPLOWO2_01_FULL_49_25 TaxID=1802701 RepID=A0A1F8GVV3_9BACT|nr:MAG: glutaminyl-tRNA synthase (glutamine-hydrolyzing) subunit A [Candidatus Yanofskybacteria bacterium RIFCSPLOWO2_01_FULL_49_25]
MDLHKLTIKKARQMLDKKEVSPKELYQAHLDRIHERNPKINAYLSVFEDTPSTDILLPTTLNGIPGIIKDNILIEGRRSTGGSKILENYTATYDATAVARLKQQGAVFLGKGNCDEFGMGTTGENSAYGLTLNPHDLTRVAGGSSSGPAAAVTDGMALFGLGTDTGGSCRMPASWCGIVGLKPTYGRVSRHGLMPMAASLNTIGTITKNVEDAAIMLSAIAGHDPMDAATSPLPVPDYTKVLGKSIRGMRVGVPKEFFASGLEEQTATSVKKAITQLESLGANIDEVSLPLTDYAIATYYIIVPSEVSADMARYDGIRYGLSVESKTLLDTYLESRDQGFGAEVKRRIMIGTYALSAGYYDAYYKKAQQVRSLVCRDFATLFAEYDVIVGPTGPQMAPKIGEFDNPLAFYLADVFTVQANLAGLPAISIPCGFGEVDGSKLPIGFQIIGKQFDEEKIFQVAYAYEQSRGSTLT